MRSLMLLIAASIHEREERLIKLRRRMHATPERSNQEHETTNLVVGTPASNTEAIALWESHGFSSTPSSHRMIYGKETGFGQPDKIYAIANGAMG